jgi:hypothetical protein
MVVSVKAMSFASAASFFFFSAFFESAGGGAAVFWIQVSNSKEHVGVPSCLALPQTLLFWQPSLPPSQLQTVSLIMQGEASYALSVS